MLRQLYHRFVPSSKKPQVLLWNISSHLYHQPSIEENFTKKEDSKLYEGHLEANYFQKALLSVGASVACLLNPARHDLVAVLGETTGHFALSNMHSSMLKDPEGALILKEKPRINTQTINLDWLSNLPTNSLGYAYTQFLSKNNVTPDSRLPVRFVDNSELAYVMQRYREVHDLFHTVLEMPTNMLGEVAVKWVEALQTGLPMCIGSSLFGPIRLKPKQRVKYVKEILPWALRVGQRAKPLINIYFEQRWEQRLEDIQKELLIEPPPKM